jgi:hypothetical protein
VLVPDGRDAEPRRPEIAQGPRVRLWLNGAKEPERNFASLLNEPFDKELMKYYVTGQIGVVNVKTHALRKIGAPAMVSAVDAGPDANYFRVTTMDEPFSYVVQYNSFGTTQEIWDATGKVLAQIDKRPSREGQEPDTTAAGGFGGRGGRGGAYRGLSWMPQGPGLYFIESETPARGADSTAGAGGAPARQADAVAAAVRQDRHEGAVHGHGADQQPRVQRRREDDLRCRQRQRLG